MISSSYRGRRHDVQGDATDMKIIISGIDCDLIEPVASDFIDNLSNDLALDFSVIKIHK